MAEEPVKCRKPIKSWMITKNVVLVSFAVMLNYTAYLGAVNLQSSINSEDGLGTTSLATINITMIFSNTFLAVSMIKWLGTKWTISLAIILFLPYIAAQMYPTFYTMIPAAILIGIVCGPLWPAIFTHISVCAETQSRISNTQVEEVLPRFFGMFFMIHQMNQVWGNLISSLVLTAGHNMAAITSVNESLIPIMCGADFLPNAHADEALPLQPPERIRLLSGIYMLCIAVAALVVAVGLDPLSSYNYKERSKNKQTSLELLVIIFKLMMEPTMLLLVIINIFIGLEQAFIGENFSSAFVSCAVGTGYIGFIMMVLGFFNAIGSLLMRYLAKILRRLYLICTATCVHAALLCTMLLWRPQAGEIYVLYIIAAFWGLCDSIWLVQMNSYYAILFPGREEAAFSNCQLWQSVGFILTYAISPYIMSCYKTYLLLATMIVGVLGYFITEYQQKKIRKEEECKRNSYNYTSIKS